MSTERLYQCVERFFARSGCTQWPTVRQCAKKLGVPQREIMALVEDDERLFTTYWNVNWEVRDGDRFVESVGSNSERER